MRIATMTKRVGVIGAATAALLIGTATAALAGDENGNGLVDRGDTGGAVTCVQQLVTWEGINVGSIDGRFGTNTVNGVRAYQDKFDLDVDGKVGRNTGSQMVRHAQAVQRDAQQQGETAVVQRYREWINRCNPLLPG